MIWEGLGKQILTLFTVGALSGASFDLFGLSPEVDKMRSRRSDLRKSTKRSPGGPI